MLSVGLLMRAAAISVSMGLGVLPGATAATTQLVPRQQVLVHATSAGLDTHVANVFVAFKGRQPSDGESALGGALMSRSGPGALIDELSLSREWLGPFVDDIYRRALDREPDTVGRDYWISQLQRGLTTKEILDPILVSAEFEAATAANDAEVVSRLFRQILERDVDPAGAAYWAERVSVVGASVVAAALFDSPENRRRQVSVLYQKLLCRDADASGLQYWADRIGQGRDLEMAKAIATTAEFLNAQNSCATTSAEPVVAPELDPPVDPNSDPAAVVDPPTTEPDTETPVEPDTETPVEPDTETPVDPDTDTPVDPDLETPVEPDTETPVEPDTETPVEPGSGNTPEPRPAPIGQTWEASGDATHSIEVTRSGFTLTDLETGRTRTLVGIPIHVSSNGLWALTRDGVAIRVHNLEDGTSEVVELDWSNAPVALYRVGNDGQRLR